MANTDYKVSRDSNIYVIANLPDEYKVKYKFYSDINTAVADAPAGSCIKVEAGTYSLSGALTISKPINIHFERGVMLRYFSISITSLGVNFLGYPDLFECTVSINNNEASETQKIRLEIGDVTVTPRSLNITFGSYLGGTTGTNSVTVSSRQGLLENDILDIGWRIRNMEGYPETILRASMLDNSALTAATSANIITGSRELFMTITGNHIHDIIVNSIVGYRVGVEIFNSMEKSKLCIKYCEGKIKFSPVEALRTVQEVIYDTLIVCATLRNEGAIDVTTEINNLYLDMLNCRIKNTSSITASACYAIYQNWSSGNIYLRLMNTMLICEGGNRSINTSDVTSSNTFTGNGIIANKATENITDTTAGAGIVIDADANFLK